MQAWCKATAGYHNYSETECLKKKRGVGGGGRSGVSCDQPTSRAPEDDDDDDDVALHVFGCRLTY